MKMSEQLFWEIIDSAWADSPDLNEKRIKSLKTNDEEVLEELSEALSDSVLENYNERLLSLDKEGLTAFIHILEKKLYEIDREEIQQYTDGSDDGFLYCRCFIVGMGEKYYQMVNNEPSTATMDLEAESFGFSAYKLFEKKFGEEFERNSVYCIESCSNEKGWNN